MIELLMTSLALGATYALVGAAVAVVAVTARTLHLAVGHVLVAGVLVALVLGSTAVGWPVVAVVTAALLVGATLSAALGPLVLDRLVPGLTWVVGLVVAAAVIEALLARVVGATPLRPDPLVALPTVGGIEPAVTSAIAVGLPAVGALALALRRTRWGVRLRLVGGSPEAAERAGISPPLVRAQALAAGGAAVVLAGLLVAPVSFVGTGQAAGFTVRGVAAAALVGTGGPAWALAGGLLLGIAEVAGASWWPAAGGEVAVAAVIVVALAVRGGGHVRAWGREW